MRDKQLFTDQTMGGHATSESILLENQVGVYTVQSIWTGAPVGNLILEATNKESATDDDYTTVHTLSVSGGAGDLLINAYKPGYKYARVRYERTSGTGTLNCFFVAKINFL